jgi:hypothetical protein
MKSSSLSLWYCTLMPFFSWDHARLTYRFDQVISQFYVTYNTWIFVDKVPIWCLLQSLCCRLQYSMCGRGIWWKASSYIHFWSQGKFLWSLDAKWCTPRCEMVSCRYVCDRLGLCAFLEARIERIDHRQWILILIQACKNERIFRV